MPKKKLEETALLGRGVVDTSELVKEQTDPKIKKLLARMVARQKKISGQPSITVK